MEPATLDHEGELGPLREACADGASGSEADMPEANAPVPKHCDAALLAFADGLLIQPVAEGDLLGSSDMADDGEQTIEESSVDGGGQAAAASTGPGSASASSSSIARAGARASLAASPAEAAMPAVSEVVEGMADALGIAAEAPSGATSSATQPTEADVWGAIAAPQQLQQQASLETTVDVGAAVEGGPFGWTLTGRGHVFDEQRRYKGRITTWGKNVAAKPLVGKSRAIQRAWATDGQMMLWMQSDFAEALKPQRPLATTA